MSRSVAAVRPGASKSTVARSSAAMRVSRSRRSRPLRGRKPSKDQRGAEMPLATSAASTADGPGMGTTVPPSATQRATRSSPGSLTSGVPASVTSATSSPAARRASSSRVRAESLWAWKLTSGVSMPWRAHNRRVRRVSSAATTLTARSTSRARKVTSPRLPMGVATT